MMFKERFIDVLLQSNMQDLQDEVLKTKDAYRKQTKRCPIKGCVIIRKLKSINRCRDIEEVFAHIRKRRMQ